MIPCPPLIHKKLEEVVGFPVSRETMSLLFSYLSFLEEESKKYNLIGPKELEKIWDRHVLDSAQLYPFLKNTKKFLDVGSGAGLPGVVLSLLGASGAHLLDSSQKKCQLLESVSRETGAAFSVLRGRVEALEGHVFDTVVARAVAPIETLLLWCRGVSTFQTRYLFLKGASFQEEIDSALQKASFQYSVSESLTSSEGKIISLWNVSF
ncbi:16S rRNA (guanine(527)-N(7))-methyltransferase RsmG [Alphaproteobacteria bacterium]|nr:16S rRNA (guanine(527)-N(7))-methyltransferase RsmG [Alphaproteobacteria bacterium]